MLHSLMLLIGLTSTLGLSAIHEDIKTYENDNHISYVERKATPKRVSYNDETHVISLSLEEISYSYTNLYTSFGIDGGDSVYTPTEIHVNEAYFSYEEINNGLMIYSGDGLLVKFNDEGLWSIYNGSTELNFYTGMDITFSSYSYETAKTAVELDIQANANNDPDMLPVLTELVTLMTGGIVQFANGLGTGVSSLVTSIFLNNGQLSVFGAIICVFGGIALAIGLSRWVMNFLTSLGAKK